MLTSRLELPIEVKNSTQIYTLKQKLRGKGSLGVTLKKLRSGSGTDYKLIQLNFLGKIKGKRKRIKKVQKHLSYYNQNSAVPKLVYSDTDSLLLEWVDGTRFDKLDKEKSDYINLAKFNASNTTEIEKLPVRPILDKRIYQVQKLKELNAIDDKLEKSILTCYSNKNILNSGHMIETLCFADSALKNYIKDQDGNLVYIDIFGINRRHIGRVFIKQLTQIPKQYRSAYSNAFRNALSTKMLTTLPFSFLNYLITRLYSNVTKRKFTDIKRRKRKTEGTLSDLNSFLAALENESTVEDWIFNHKF